MFCVGVAGAKDGWSAMSSGGVVCRGKEVLSCFLRHFLSGPPSIHIPHPWLSSCGEALGGCGVGVGVGSAWCSCLEGCWWQSMVGWMDLHLYSPQPSNHLLPSSRPPRARKQSRSLSREGQGGGSVGWFQPENTELGRQAVVTVHPSGGYSSDTHTDAWVALPASCGSSHRERTKKVDIFVTMKSETRNKKERSSQRN